MENVEENIKPKRKYKKRKQKIRKKKYVNSPESLNELEKFIRFCGSIRKAAIKMDIAPQNIYLWRLNYILIPDSRAEFMAQISGVDKQLLMKRNFSKEYKESNLFSSLRELIARDHMLTKVNISEMSSDEIYDTCLSQELLGYINDINIIDSEEKIQRAAKMLSAIFASKPSKWVKDIRYLKSLK